MADTSTLQELEQRSTALRAELKQWEKAFAQASGGRKAGRDEIKSDPVIALKYKEYNRVREAILHPAGSSSARADIAKATPSTPQHAHVQRKRPRRDHGDAMHGGVSEEGQGRSSLQFKPRERNVSPSLQCTPRRSERHAQQIRGATFLESPASVESVRMKTHVDATPQKDGRVLGLFDVIPEEEGEDDEENAVATPSKNRPSDDSVTSQAKARVVLGLVDANGSALGVATPSRHRLDRTPQSAGKRFLLSQFVTPSKRKSPDVASSARKRLAQTTDLSSTPSFLRRRSCNQPPTLESIVEEGDEDNAACSRDAAGASQSALQQQQSSILPLASVPRPLLRRKFGRSLSDLMKENRRAEDERLDEDMDLLREMEAEGTTDGTTAEHHATMDPTDANAPKLGPDGTYLSDEEDADKSAPQAGQGRVWKKRGAKRQTRKFNLKPIAKRKPDTQASNAAQKETTFLDSASSEDTELPKSKSKSKDGHDSTKRTSTHANAPERPRVKWAADPPATAPAPAQPINFSRKRPRPVSDESVTPLLNDVSGSDETAVNSEHDDSDTSGDDDTYVEDKDYERSAPTPPKRRRIATPSEAHPSVRTVAGDAPSAQSANGDVDVANNKKAASSTSRTPGAVAKQALRKVNEAAHANFRKLKIRGKGGSNGTGAAKLRKGRWGGKR